MVTFTDRAGEALVLFHTAAARWDPDVHVRLVPDGAELKPQLATGPEAGDIAIAVGGVTVFVPEGVDGTVDAGDHNVLTVTPS
jgi:hypothetical protein